MPHLRIEYSANLIPRLDIDALCQSLAQRLAGLRDAHDQPTFPLAGSRVLAFPAPYYAVAGRADFGFMYLNLRITPGRSRGLLDAAGAALLETVKAHFAPLHDRHPIGVTLHIDEVAPAYEGKFSNLAS